MRVIRHMFEVRRLLIAALAALLASSAGRVVVAQPTRAEVVAQMQPYAGASAEGVDRTTLTGKVVAGYQGWFTAEGDGAGTGWRHYSKRGQFRPGSCNIDLWPDVSELDDDEKFASRSRLHP